MSFLIAVKTKVGLLWFAGVCSPSTRSTESISETWSVQNDREYIRWWCLLSMVVTCKCFAVRSFLLHGRFDFELKLTFPGEMSSCKSRN